MTYWDYLKSIEIAISMNLAVSIEHFTKLPYIFNCSNFNVKSWLTIILNKTTHGQTTRISIFCRFQSFESLVNLLDFIIYTSSIVYRNRNNSGGHEILISQSMNSVWKELETWSHGWCSHSWTENRNKIRDYLRSNKGQLQLYLLSFFRRFVLKSIWNLIIAYSDTIYWIVCQVENPSTFTFDKQLEYSSLPFDNKYCISLVTSTVRIRYSAVITTIPIYSNDIMQSERFLIFDAVPMAIPKMSSVLKFSLKVILNLFQ